MQCYEKVHRFVDFNSKWFMNTNGSFMNFSEPQLKFRINLYSLYIAHSSDKLSFYRVTTMIGFTMIIV